MFTTYSSSAGSGKTTQLVADYLTLCFRSDNQNLYRQILAITFTNNASAEMKDRILNCLNAFAFQSYTDFSGSDKAIYQKIADRLFPKPDLKTMQEKARRLLQLIVYDYARFTVSTIDSFFQRIIRSSAFMLHLNVNYAVKIKWDEYILQATDQILNELHNNKELAARVIYLLERKLEEQGKLNIDREFKNALDLVYSEKSFQYVQSLVQNYTSLTEQIHHWSIEWSEKRKVLKGQIEQLENEYREIKKQLEQATDTAQQRNFKEIKKQFEANNLISNRSGKVKEEHPFKQEENTCRVLLQNLPKLSLMFDLREKMDQLKKRDNIFLLSEANQLLYNTIYADRESLALFDKLKFTHFFIDEFQDTSKMQWEDLKPLLINNALSQIKGGVTLFGDLKQAIYRFRNGDADLFYQLTDWQRFNATENFKTVSKSSYQNISLDTNYRSTQSVIAFNNAFFEFITADIPSGVTKEYYKETEQEIHADKQGLVKVILRDKFNKTVFDSPKGKITNINEESYCVLLAVKEAIDMGYSYKDIAILVAGNIKCVKLCDLLMREGYPVISSAELSLDTSPAVNVIISMLKMLYTSGDRLAQATLLCHLDPKAQKEKVMNELLTLKDDDFLTFFHQKTGKTIPFHHWLSQPLFFLVKDIIAFFKLEGDPYVMDFENVVLQYLRTLNGDPYKFLLWWKQCADLGTTPSLTFPEGVEAITVSTIHKVKGLEFPVVIFSYTQPDNQLDSVWVEYSEKDLFSSSASEDNIIDYIDLSQKNCSHGKLREEYDQEKEKKDLDELNKKYVAHTRAADLLYLIATYTPEKRGNLYGDDLFDFIKKHKEMPPSFTELSDGSEELKAFYYGDKDWKNPRKESITEEMPLPVSDGSFNLRHIRILPPFKHDDPRAIGLYVHDFLSKLSRFPQNEAEIEQMLVNVPADRKSDLQNALRIILADESLKPYFAPEAEVLNEVSILDENGELHRPDRIVFEKDKVVVLDYKTGTPQPQYQRQIDTYCRLIREMGYGQVEGKLVYL